MASVYLPDGRALLTCSAGSGIPLVVFESGGGLCLSVFTTVQRMVAEYTSTVAYDRAGYGGSDDGPQPRTLARIVEDLAGLIDAVSPHDPVVLVGASLGGEIARGYADAHPDRLRGLVLLDPVSSQSMSPRLLALVRAVFSATSALSRIGGHRPLARFVLSEGSDADIPAGDRELITRAANDGRNWRAAGREVREADPTMAEQRRLESMGLPDVPVTTMVGERAGRLERRMRPALLAAARREMEAHPRGRFVAATRSNHFIPWQEPRLVADEILRLL